MDRRIDIFAHLHHHPGPTDHLFLSFCNAPLRYWHNPTQSRLRPGTPITTDTHFVNLAMSEVTPKQNIGLVPDENDRRYTALSRL